MADTVAKMVKRHQRVAFMNTDKTGSSPKYERMTRFTSMKNSKGAKEYSRQYVDKESEDTDVVGYSPSIEYSFDRYTNTPVHDRIAEIHDGEKTGSDALVDIVIVDLFTEIQTFLEPVFDAMVNEKECLREWTVNSGWRSL